MALSRNDLKSLLNSKVLKAEWVEELSKGFGEYEKKIRAVVHDLDIKGREAKSKGLKQLDQLTVQVKKTGGSLEKRISTAVSQESERLHRKVNEVMAYLKTLSPGETTTAPVKKAKTAATKVKKEVKAAAPKAKTAAKAAAKKGGAKVKKVLASKKGQGRSTVSSPLAN